MSLYNSIGKNYNHTRQADPRIVRQLVSHLSLPKNSIVADVGAGTGNYSNAIANQDFQVIAIEPSKVMRNQIKPHPKVKWLNAAAEQIPLPENSVQASLIMLAVHHFTNPALALREIVRITAQEKIVIFTFDPSKSAEFWQVDYFPFLIKDIENTSKSMNKLVDLLQQSSQKKVEIYPFYLPPNLNDLFAASGWCRPEIYLNPQVRQGISSFAKMPVKELEEGLKRLELDLIHNVWQKKYNQLSKQKNYDAGYRILVTK